MKKLVPLEHLPKFLDFQKEFSFLLLFLLSFQLNAQNVDNGGSVASSQTICFGEMPTTLTSITPATGGGTAAIEYIWMTTTNSNNNISNWNPAPGVNNQASYTPPITGVTTYYVRCARRQSNPPFSFAIESNIVTITVLNPPTAIINNNPSTAFMGEEINLMASTTFNGTYTWDFDGDGVTDCAGQNCSFTYLTPGTYTITLTVNDGNCSISTTESITIQAPTSFGVADPCTCSDPQNYFNSSDYFVHDYIYITAAPGQTWRISSYNQGLLYDNNATSLPIFTEIPEISPGVYFLNLWFISGTGYNVSYTEGTNTLTTGTTNPCNCNNPLPVELINFDGVVEGEKVILKWATASETNNSHFEVERSLDGNRFDFVGTLAGQGNSTTTNYYTLEDKSPMGGETYYRLKQVDLDGTYTLSDIVPITIETKSIITSVIPNPVRHNALVRFADNLPLRAKLEVKSATGSVLQTYNIEGTAQTIDVEKLERGIYFLRIKNAAKEQKAYYRFVKI